MPAERTRPPLSGEAVSTEELRDDDGTLEGTIEVHTFDPVPFEPSAALAEAIKQGHVVTHVENVKADAKDKDGNVVKRFQQKYTTCVAKNRTGAIALPNVDGDEEKLWKLVSDGADRNTFQSIYVDMRNAASGPEKQIARIAKILAGMTEEQKLVALKELGLVS